MPIKASQIKDLDLVTEPELAAGNADTLVPKATWPIGVDSFDTNGYLYLSIDSITHTGLEVGDTIWITSSGGSADGYYTVIQVSDSSQSWVQLDSAPASTISTGSVYGYHPAGSTKVGVDTTTLSTLTGSNLQAVLESVDGLLAPGGHTHTTGDITDFTESTQDVVGGMLTNTTYIDLSYLDSVGTFAATLNTGSVPVSDLNDNIGIATETFVQSRGLNLITNGTGMMMDQTNFTDFTRFDPAEAYSANGSHIFDDVYRGRQDTDEFIAVDASQTYRLSMYVKDGGAQAKLYAGLIEYDADDLQIRAQDHRRQSGTDTVLAQSLTPGDTVIYFNDLTNWTDGSRVFDRQIIIWGYKNSYGYTYPDYTYSRIWEDDIWDYNVGAIDYVNNTITLNKPLPSSMGNPDDPGGAWPAGHAISQGGSGVTYKYTASGGSHYTTSDWEKIEGTIGGIQLDGSRDRNKFAPGTASIKLIWLNNHADSTNAKTIYYSNIRFALDTPTRGDFIDSPTVAFDRNPYAGDTGAPTIWADVIQSAINTSAINNDAGFVDGDHSHEFYKDGSPIGNAKSFDFITGTYTTLAVTPNSTQMDIEYDVDPSTLNTSTLNNDAGFITGLDVGGVSGLVVADADRINFSASSPGTLSIADTGPGVADVVMGIDQSQIDTGSLNNNAGFISEMEYYDDTVLVGTGTRVNFQAGNNISIVGSNPSPDAIQYDISASIPSHTHDHEIAVFEAHSSAAQQISGTQVLAVDTISSNPQGIFTMPTNGIYECQMDAPVLFDMQSSFVTVNELSEFRAWLELDGAVIAGTYIYETLGDPTGSINSEFCSIAWRRVRVNPTAGGQIRAMVDIMDYGDAEAIEYSTSVLITSLLTEATTP